MPSSGNMPAKVKKTLTQLGVKRISDVEKIREHLVEIASLGTPLLPEFTLHNQTHSDNLICLLGRLRKEFGLKLNESEAFLLTASAYLHDLGMFFDGKAFEEEILPDLAAALSFCPQGLCDTVGNYQFFGLDTGAQIREAHSLLSAYWLYHEVTPINGITDNDRPYLMAICRGHGKANLKEHGCWCYRTTSRDGEEIRTGLLTSLLRLVDALDFYSNRAPTSILQMNAATFLENPVSLGHWIKHYFVQDPFIVKANEGGNFVLQCTVYFAVPAKKLNGIHYLDFFRPLFDKHIKNAQEWDLDVNKYPPDLTTALGINNIKLVVDHRAVPGNRDLPDRIVREIEQTSCRDVLEFLEHRASTVKRDSRTGEGDQVRGKPESAASELPSEPVLIIEDAPWYREHLVSILAEVGYQCEQAGTFEEALRKLNECNPFVVLLDVKLDGEFKHGWELARAAVDKGVPIIVVTGYPSIEGVNKAIREFDAVYFFDKSRLSPEDLIPKVYEAALRTRGEKLGRDQRQALFERLLGFFPNSQV